MSNTGHTFLVELGTEELPPKSLPRLIEAFADHLSQSLHQLNLSFSKMQMFATPRRLALLVSDLPATTPEQTLTVWGPPANIAFDAQGKPSRAAEAFASKNGVAVEALTTANDGKVDKLVAHTRAGGDAVVGLLPDLVDKALAALPVDKRMRWGSSRNEFVRPVQWLVMLWGDTVIPCEILGLQAGRVTRGHRFHSEGMLELSQPEEYEPLLEAQGRVIASFEKRRAIIRAQVLDQAQAVGGRAQLDEALLDEVTALVEWPVALTGQFDPAFLAVPSEALISSMKEHQKYFHLLDAQGRLLPRFIAVANLASRNPQAVVQGNEKVIRPRLADAAFFYHTDRQTPLMKHREKLRTVVFQGKLGSLFDKTERLAALARELAEPLGLDVQLAGRAAQLAKADLVTQMVYEFAEMQGTAGMYYARHDDEAEELAQALNEQYQPRFARDSLPQSALGTLLALVDRLDTLAGIFGLGQVPTGSKDPFGLRRSSVAVLRLLIEKRMDLDLERLLQQAAAQYTDLPKGQETVSLALAYMLERLRAWYEEAGISHEVYQSVSVRGLTCPLDIDDRVQAVAAFAELPQAAALAAANKRVSNILSKQGTMPATGVSKDLLTEPAERALADAVRHQRALVEPLLAERRYREALATLASLREPVDRFFDDVMVMTDDPALRNNRLALLAELRELFLQVADISHLVVSH